MNGPREGGQRTAMIRVLSVRRFGWLWAGQLVSSTGDGVQSVALLWFVMNLTHSAALVGVTLLVGASARLGSMAFAGVLVDRYGPQQLMLFSDTVRCVLVTVMAATVLSGSLTFRGLLVFVLLQGAASGLFVPAMRSMVPVLVEPALLLSATAVWDLAPQFALVVGAPLGGWLVARAGIVPAFFVNAGTFAVASATSLVVGFGLTRSRAAAVSQGLWAEFIDGWSVVTEQRKVVGYLVAGAVLNFAFAGPFAVALPWMAHHQPLIGAEGLGMEFGGFGLGTMVGLVIAGLSGSQLVRPGNLPLLIGLEALCILAIPYVPWPGILAVLVCLGLLAALDGVLIQIAFQRGLMVDMVGRVTAFLALATQGLQPLSQAMTGAAVAWWGVAPAFIVAAGLVFLTALAFRLRISGDLSA